MVSVRAVALRQGQPQLRGHGVAVRRTWFATAARRAGAKLEELRQALTMLDYAEQRPWSG